MHADDKRKIESIFGHQIISARPLSGGKISRVFKIASDSGARLVAKIGDGGHDLSIEGYMLRYLRAMSQLPLPRVYHAEPALLLMDYVNGRTGWFADSLAHLGETLAICHQISAQRYGLERDTLIGPLHQPNKPSSSWIKFFREQRLLYMTRIARESGNLPIKLEARLRKFAHSVESYLIEPEKPALIHGDMWRTNVITRDKHIVGIIDPALYYAHNEMELAYMTLFSELGDVFFAAYQAIQPIDNDFFHTRRHVYNLYPLLVHVKVFGAEYLQPIDTTLRRFNH